MVQRAAMDAQPDSAGGYLVSDGPLERAIQPGTLAGELARLGARFEIAAIDAHGRLVPIISQTPVRSGCHTAGPSPTWTRSSRSIRTISGPSEQGQR